MAADIRGWQPHDGVRAQVLNPLRSEGEAFRFFVYVVIILFTIVAIVLILKSL